MRYAVANLSDLKATFLLAVLAIAIEMRFVHHFVTALILEAFALPSKAINLWRIYTTAYTKT